MVSPKFEESMHKIHLNEQKSEKVFKMVVEAPYIAQHRKAGQFIILRIDERGERVPLTIVDSNIEDGTITLYYLLVGRSTDKLSQKKPGESILDISGPLGHATDVNEYGTAVCVGGGIGIAPILPIASELKKKGNRVITIIGGRNKELLLLEDELKDQSEELIICTDDGSAGKKGFVTDALKDLMAQEKIDFVVAVGPVPMMKAVSEVTRDDKIKTLVSLNSIMLDGTGMCGGCRVSIDGKTQFTCVDGPEFDGHTVDFIELMTRLGTYKDQEEAAVKHHKCRLTGEMTHG